MRTLLLLCCLTLISCVHLFITHVDYATKGAAPVVAGSAFRAEFIPLGTESGLAVSAGVVGGATVGEIGPYQVRLHAFGKAGDQEAFRVTRFVLTSPGNFTAPMEKRGFEGEAEFEPVVASPGATRASLLLGPRFRLEQGRDKELLLEADVEVRRHGRWTRGTLRLPLQQTKTRRRESSFIVTEIVKDIRGNEGPVPPALPPPPERPW
ncbi:MAG: hypothetical protein ACO1TE_24560 [Prosthecobacter sp.]